MVRLNDIGKVMQTQFRMRDSAGIGQRGLEFVRGSLQPRLEVPGSFQNSGQSGSKLWGPKRSQNVIRSTYKLAQWSKKVLVHGLLQGRRCQEAVQSVDLLAHRGRRKCTDNAF